MSRFGINFCNQENLYRFIPPTLFCKISTLQLTCGSFNSDHLFSTFVLRYLLFCFKVLAPNCDLQIFVPASISKHQESVLQLLDMHCGQTTGAINKDKGCI